MSSGPTTVTSDEAIAITAIFRLVLTKEGVALRVSRSPWRDWTEFFEERIIDSRSGTSKQVWSRKPFEP
jgi:hypothetical protein